LRTRTTSRCSSGSTSPCPEFSRTIERLTKQTPVISPHHCGLRPKRTVLLKFSKQPFFLRVSTIRSDVSGGSLRVTVNPAHRPRHRRVWSCPHDCPLRHGKTPCREPTPANSIDL
jgi:hypothetical protein